MYSHPPRLFRTTLFLCLAGMMTASPALMALEGKDLTKPEVDDLNLYMPNSQVMVTLENGSGSGKLSEFQLKIQNHTLTLNSMTGVLHCGQHSATAVKNGVPPHNGASNYDGAPRIHFGIVGNSQAASTGALYTVAAPDISITTYERSNKLNTKGYVKQVQGSPWNFSIPVNRLVKPGNAGSLDIAGEFDRRLQAFVKNGGKKIDFLRQDQHFDMVGHVTLEAACFSVMPRKAFHTRPFQVSVKYKGDTSLKNDPAIPVPGNPQVKLPFQASNVELSVSPDKITAPCPFDVIAKARIGFNQSPAAAQQYQVRFLEDGKPATPWQTRSLQGTNVAEVTHTIRIGALTVKPALVSIGKANAGNAPTPAKPLGVGINKVPTVSVEIKTTGETAKRADAQYHAQCLPKNVTTFNPTESGAADLTSRTGILLGTQSSPWNGKLVLGPSDIAEITQRGCHVRYRYDVVNIGTADAGSFQNRLLRAGQQIDNATLPSLAQNQIQYAAGVALIPAGTSVLTVAIDSMQQISELQENNNQFAVTVVAPESCGGTPARPSQGMPGTAPTGRPLR